MLPVLFAVTSVPALAYGAWKRERSPQFDDWFASLSNPSAADPGLGLGIGTWWVFVGGMGIFLVTAFCLFSVVSCVLVASRRLFIRRAAFIVATPIFFLSAAFLVSGALTSLRWGFTVYALGKAIAGVAAILGLLALWTSSRAGQDVGINYVTSLRSSTP